MGICEEEFVGEVPRYLMCSICLMVLDKATMVCEAEHALCKSWVYDANGRARVAKCPTCLQIAYGAQIRPSRVLDRMVGDLLCKCKHFPACEWVGPYSEKSSHVKSSCSEADIWCDNYGDGCRHSVKRKELHVHLVDCIYESEVCPREGAHCTGQWGGRYLRRDRETHEDICPNFSSVDPRCTTTGPRKQIKTHETSCKKIRVIIEDQRAEIGRLSLMLRDERVSAGLEKSIAVAGQQSRDRRIVRLENQVKDLEGLLGEEFLSQWGQQLGTDFDWEDTEDEEHTIQEVEQQLLGRLAESTTPRSPSPLYQTFPARSYKQTPTRDTGW